MAAEEGTFSVIFDKVSFVKQVPWLLKATSDDENPTPGYMYQEICEISLASGSYCQILLDYLLDRLEKDSCQVKLKVLRILQYVVQNGHPDFRQALRRRARGLQEASKYSGPPDPLHGNTRYAAVRSAAQNLSEMLFDVTLDDSKVPEPQPTSMKSTGGMGGSVYGNKMQGFGNAPNRPTKTLGETIVSGLKDLADRVTDPVDPRWTASQGRADPFRKGDYRPVRLPTGALLHGQPEWEKSPSSETQRVERPPRLPNSATEHRPGVAGGGWEDDPIDSGALPERKTSSGTLKSPSDRHSNDSLNSSSSTSVVHTAEISERLEEVQVEDSREEEQLVMSLVVDCDQVLPSRDKVNAFLKRCGESNSEMVIKYLNRYLQPNNEQQAFRALLLIDYLMKTDHVTIDHIVSACATQLVVIYKTARGPTKAKARKIIRQLQLLSGQMDLFAGMPPMPRFQTKSPSTDNITDPSLSTSPVDNTKSLTSVDTNSNPEVVLGSTGPAAQTYQADNLSLPGLGPAPPLIHTLPDGRSSDSSPEWPSLHIPFAGSVYSQRGGSESFSCTAHDSDSQEHLDEGNFDKHKDSSMSEDSLKEDDSVFDFLNE